MDSDEEDSFVTIGNPLPTYDEDEVPTKPTPYMEQEVRDGKGRPQRFHGAFTGGFSAGYFNTVGTKEGFTPSTFVSSRDKKAGQTQQRMEDFMDEEDMGEHGIAPRRVTTTSSFTAEDAARRETHKYRAPPGVIPGAELLNDYIVPVSASIGAKLLHKLGWREGTGIGQRVKRKRKKHKKKPAAGGQKVYGCAMPPTQDGSDTNESSGSEGMPAYVTFAPRDMNPISFEPKDNLHGLGYRGIDPTTAMMSGGQRSRPTRFSLFEEPPQPQISRTGRRGITGQAFGVGALNPDDDDIYSSDNMSNYHRVLGDAGEADDHHGWTAPQGKRTVATPVSYVGSMLEGFQLSSATLQPKKIYPPPRLPRNYRPFHQFKIPQHLITSHAGGRKERLDASSRAEALGETPNVRSVFDLVSDKDRSKMEAVKSSASNKKGPDLSQSEQASSSSSQSEQASSSGSQSASSSAPPSVENQRQQGAPLFGGTMSGFKPFAKDPVKQQRYEKYLEMKKRGETYKWDDDSSRDLTEWEREREREEFAQAAFIYKPMSSVMAARFTSAQQEDTLNILDEVKRTEVDSADTPASAAAMGMYGKMTREVHEWHPDKLVCKRFNIPNPYPESTIVGLRSVRKEKATLFNFLHVPEPEPEPEPPRALPAPPRPAVKAPARKPLAFITESLSNPVKATSLTAASDQAAETTPGGETGNQEPATVEESQQQPKEGERPPMDLFKAIFDSGSSDSSSDEDEKEEEKGNSNSRDDSASGVERVQATSQLVAVENNERDQRDQSQGPAEEEPTQPVQMWPPVEPDDDPEDSPSSTEKDNIKMEPENTKVEPVNIKVEPVNIKVEPVESRLQPPVAMDTSDTATFGPALPPGFEVKDEKPVIDSSAGLGLIRTTHHKNKHRHKDRHKDKHKEKKSKHKKEKHKKHKKEKKSRQRSPSSSHVELPSSASKGSSRISAHDQATTETTGVENGGRKQQLKDSSDNSSSSSEEEGEMKGSNNGRRDSPDGVDMIQAAFQRREMQKAGKGQGQQGAEKESSIPMYTSASETAANNKRSNFPMDTGPAGDTGTLGPAVPPRLHGKDEKPVEEEQLPKSHKSKYKHKEKYKDSSTSKHKDRHKDSSGSTYKDRPRDSPKHKEQYKDDSSSRSKDRHTDKYKEKKKSKHEKQKPKKAKQKKEKKSYQRSRSSSDADSESSSDDSQGATPTTAELLHKLRLLRSKKSASEQL